MSEITTIGLNLAKTVFQVHGVKTLLQKDLGRRLGPQIGKENAASGFADAATRATGLTITTGDLTTD